ncbi:Exopolygalacturonase-like protein [Drosera capensis]
MVTTLGRASLIKALLLLCVAFVSIEARGHLVDGDGITLIPARDEKVFNVLSFGAKPDGKTDNVEAFMDAWRAACHHPGKARFLVPPGVFLISAIIFGGPCTSKPIVFQLSGIMRAVPDVSMYETAEWLLFEDVHGLVILGGGAVDGQGHLLWPYNDCKKNKDCARLPASIILNKVSDVSVRRIKSLNPMGFHYFVSRSQNVRLQRLRIIAPETSPNTDGIHISSSDLVRIARSRIETGDDCVGILQGSTRITINRVTCGPGHGISIGSLGKYEDELDVSGIQVKNCTLKGTDNGLRIKTWPFKPNVIPIKASGFWFQDVILNNVKNPILIDQEYCGGSHSCNMQPSKIRLSNIFFFNIVGTSVTPQAINIKCSSAVPCQNVHFNNVNLKTANGAPTTSTCMNAKVDIAGTQLPALSCH